MYGIFMNGSTFFSNSTYGKLRLRLLWRFRSTVYNTGILRVKCVMYMIMRPCLENMAR